jgi:HK97 family phage portal protein
MSPDRIMPMLVNGALWYRVKNEGADETLLRPSEVFHVRGLGDDLCGWSVIQHAAQAIGLGTAQDQSMASLIANGSRPAGLITPVGTLSKDAANRIVEEWEATYGGAKNKGKTALLSHAMSYTALALPNTDAQMLESRRFSVLEICRFFRVPPHMVMDLERATFSNIEHQAIEFVQHTLVPWIVKLEQEANRKLISSVNRGRVFTKMNINALLRGDFESRAKGYQMLFDRGVYSINDILELEDRNTIGPDGDIRLVPMNMQTIENALEPPEPPQPPPGPPEDDEPPDDQNGNGDALDAYRPLLYDALDRITARECRLLERDQSARWVDNGHRGYVQSCLAPHVAAVARFGGRSLDIGNWTDRRCERLKAEITGHLAAGGGLGELLTMWSDRVELDTNDILGVQYAAIQG